MALLNQLGPCVWGAEIGPSQCYQ
uniref:Uncharacterized protein n=1 Tax=Anguilla anguilla TaxID=7936 RepID=A0A0E9Q8J9_ANGAN